MKSGRAYATAIRVLTDAVGGAEGIAEAVLAENWILGPRSGRTAQAALEDRMALRGKCPKGEKYLGIHGRAWHGGKIPKPNGRSAALLVSLRRSPYKGMRHSAVA